MEVTMPRLPDLDTRDCMQPCATCGNPPLAYPVQDYDTGKDEWWVCCRNRKRCTCEVGPLPTEIEARTEWNITQRNRKT